MWAETLPPGPLFSVSAPGSLEKQPQRVPVSSLYNCQGPGFSHRVLGPHSELSELSLDSPWRCPQYQAQVLSVPGSAFISLHFGLLVALGPRVSDEPTQTCKLETFSRCFVVSWGEGLQLLYSNQKLKVMSIHVILNHTPFEVKNLQSPASGASEETRESVDPGPVWARHWPPGLGAWRRPGVAAF